MGNDFLAHFSYAICSIGVVTSNKSGGGGLQFIKKGKLEVVSKLFVIVPLGRIFLVSFHVDHTAINIDDDGFDLALFIRFLKTLRLISLSIWVVL